MTTFDYNYQNSFCFCFVNEICQSRWGLKNNSSNLHKKTTNWRILVVVVKWRHRAIVLLQQIVDSSSFWARILDFAYNEDIFARILDSRQNFNGGLVNKFKVIMDQQICLPLFTPLLFQSPLPMSTTPPSPFPRLSAQVDPHAKLYHGNLSGTKLVIYKLRCLQASSPRGRGAQNEERNPTWNPNLSRFSLPKPQEAQESLLAG